METNSYILDAWGDALGMPRNDDEDDVSYRARLLAELKKSFMANEGDKR